MKTKVLNHDQRQLWEGDLPIIPAGHRINHEGRVYKVIGSGVALTGHYPSELDHSARQTLVLQEVEQ